MVQELQTNSFEYIETRPSAKFRYSNLLLSRAKFLGVSERLTPENAEEFHASFYEFYESLSTPAVVLNGDRVTALYQAFNGTGELALFGHAAELFGLYRRIKFGRFGIAVTYFIFSIVFPQLAKEELLARTAGAHILAESMGTYTTKRLNWRAWKYEKNSEALRLYRFLATQWVGSTEETNSAGFITFTRDVTFYEQISRENQGCLPEGFTFSLLGSLDSTPMISVSSQGFMQTIIPKLVARVLIAEFGVHLMKALRKTAPPRGLRWRQGLRMVDEVLGFISPLRRTHQLWKRVRRS